jgi:hypothetical protein
LPEVERGAFKGILWARRALFALLLGFGLWNAVGTSAFLLRSIATTGHVVGRHSETVHYPMDSRYRGMTFFPVTSSYVEIAYADSSGRPRWAVIPEAACWHTNEARLPIRYSDGDTQRVMVNTFFGLWCKAVVLVAAGAMGWAVVELVMR